MFAIAEAEGVEPTAPGSPVLYDCVGAAAVESTVFGCTPPNRGFDAVSFRHRSYVVMIRRNGRIRVYDRD